MDNQNLDNIVNEAVEKIKEMPNGTIFTIYKLLNEYGSKDLFDITFKILEKVKELNITLESVHGEDAIVGLPYNIEYVKRDFKI